MGVLEAVKTLLGADLRFSIAFVEAKDGFLKVVAQDPASGQQVDPGTSVKLSIGIPGFLLGAGRKSSGRADDSTIPCPATFSALDAYKFGADDALGARGCRVSGMFYSPGRTAVRRLPDILRPRFVRGLGHFPARSYSSAAKPAVFLVLPRAATTGKLL